eukprot:363511-Chlamydomonas_euryale.AAC.2
MERCISGKKCALPLPQTALSCQYHANILHKKQCSTPHERNSSCPCSTSCMKSASHGFHQVTCIVPGSVPAALPSLRSKPQTFVNFMQMTLHLLLAAAAALRPRSLAPRHQRCSVFERSTSVRQQVGDGSASNRLPVTG